MQSLRHARHLARLVLAWFALSLGVAVASPVFHAAGLELVCTASGAAKLLDKQDTGGTASLHHGLDCPLCTVAGAPPPVVPTAAPLLPPATVTVPPAAGAHAFFAAAPPPARGPPA